MKNLLLLFIELPKKIKRFIQRGLHGISEEDMWNLDYFISNAVVRGVDYLKEKGKGHPGDLSCEEWDKSLDEMQWTFEIAKGIVEGHIIYFELDNYDKMTEKHKKFYEEFDDVRLLTKAEVKRMNDGFELFKNRFFSLWD